MSEALGAYYHPPGHEGNHQPEVFVSRILGGTRDALPLAVDYRSLGALFTEELADFRLPTFQPGELPTIFVEHMYDFGMGVPRFRRKDHEPGGNSFRVGDRIHVNAGRELDTPDLAYSIIFQAAVAAIRKSEQQIPKNSLISRRGVLPVLGLGGGTAATVAIAESLGTSAAIRALEIALFFSAGWGLARRELRQERQQHNTERATKIAGLLLSRHINDIRREEG